MPEPDEPIDLKLGVSERLTIQQLTMVEPEIAERAAKAPKDQKKTPFTLNELDHLIGHHDTNLSQLNTLLEIKQIKPRRPKTPISQEKRS